MELLVKKLTYLVHLFDQQYSKKSVSEMLMRFKLISIVILKCNLFLWL